MKQVACFRKRGLMSIIQINIKHLVTHLKLNNKTVLHLQGCNGNSVYTFLNRINILSCQSSTLPETVSPYLILSLVRAKVGHRSLVQELSVYFFFGFWGSGSSGTLIVPQPKGFARIVVIKWVPEKLQTVKIKKQMCLKYTH